MRVVKIALWIFRKWLNHGALQDLDKDDYVPEPFRKVNPEELHAMQSQQKKGMKDTDKKRAKRLADLGFEMEHSGEVLF